jgi:RNA recognition motif-containing protein
MSAKLFVGNLDFNTSKQEVETLFSQVGEIREVFLPTDRMSGRPRGFAFVEYELEEDAETAIERFNGYELSGRPLRVNPAEDRPRRPPGGPSFTDAPPFGGGRGFPGKPKGSRRNIRAKKRSL